MTGHVNRISVIKTLSREQSGDAVFVAAAAEEYKRLGGMHTNRIMPGGRSFCAAKSTRSQLDTVISIGTAINDNY